MKPSYKGGFLILIFYSSLNKFHSIPLVKLVKEYLWFLKLNTNCTNSIGTDYNPKLRRRKPAYLYRNLLQSVAKT